MDQVESIFVEGCSDPYGSTCHHRCKITYHNKKEGWMNIPREIIARMIQRDPNKIKSLNRPDHFLFGG